MATATRLIDGQARCRRERLGARLPPLPTARRRRPEGGGRPPKLAARARLLDNGDVNKNDPNDARSVAVAALRAKRLSEVTKEDHAAVMRLWARRRKDLTSARTRVANRLHAVILALVPGAYAGEIYAAR